ncbi:hypothetical protein [Lutibacter sp.]|uniref:hypothetical protein n=1 Tax=Lutibacter sp. TaxID=1925666 RepID=UPI0025BD0B64|nr:hypothetical protein [Lutibacter sp.]MCF6181538.1 hypothetical protein [Lutibacter sp.]
MKKINILLVVLVVLASCSGNSQNKLKRYNVKSAIIQYNITTSGKTFGSTIKGSGTENLYFKDWGAVELTEEKSTQTTITKIFGRGKTKTTNTHTVKKLDNGESYLADFDKKTIYLTRDLAMDMMKQSNTDAGEAGKSMLESIGGKKVGNENFMGYKCEVWSVPGGKQWMHKGVVLKLQMKILGITTVKEATSVKINVSVPDSNFKLPNFPIQKMEGYRSNDEYNDDMEEMDANMGKIQNLSFEEWKKMATKNDSEMKNMSDEELHQTYDMIQKMIKMRRGN